MRVAITGADGLVGRALANEYREHEVAALSHRDLDITDPTAVARVMGELRPQIIFNCAVIGVDECETHPDLASRVNVIGPANLAEAARESAATIVHFSTNYVFDGARAASRPAAADESSFYTIEDEPRPVNVYGRTKLEGEHAVARRSPRAFIIRTSWVFGPGKASFLATVSERLKRNEAVKAINDVWASTTYVLDLVRRAEEIVRIGHPAIYHVVNSGVCSYEEFAREAALLIGAEQRLIESVSEATLMRAPRPRWTPMRCLESERLGLSRMRHWSAALACFNASP
jgi:dTDP-4-dehydrorhamnose reductase